MSTETTSGKTGLLTVTGAAAFMGLNPKTFRKYVSNGVLPAATLDAGTRRYWNPSVLEAVKNGEVPQDEADKSEAAS